MAHRILDMLGYVTMNMDSLQHYFNMEFWLHNKQSASCQLLMVLLETLWNVVWDLWWYTRKQMEQMNQIQQAMVVGKTEF